MISAPASLPTSQLVPLLNGLLRPGASTLLLDEQVEALVPTLQQRQLKFSLAKARRYYRHPELQQLSAAGRKTQESGQKASLQAQLKQRIAELGGPANPATEQACESCGFYWTAIDTIHGYLDTKTPNHVHLLQLLQEHDLLHEQSPLKPREMMV